MDSIDMNKTFKLVAEAHEISKGTRFCLKQNQF